MNDKKPFVSHIHILLTPVTNASLMAISILISKLGCGSSETALMASPNMMDTSAAAPTADYIKEMSGDDVVSQTAAHDRLATYVFFRSLFLP